MIFLLLGPSGVGKDTVANELGLPQVISTTTRDMRPGEVQDKTYHFVTDEEFENLELLERVEYAGNKYGLQKADIQAVVDSRKDHYIILDRKGCEIVKNIFLLNSYIIFLTAPPEKLVEFMRKRGDSDEAIINRLCNIITDRELDNGDIADLVVETGDIQVVVDKVKNYINGLKAREQP